MAHRARLALTAVIFAWLVLPAVPAAAGGGCHTGATQGAGDVVVMQDACFTPTILWVEPGATIAFSNKDPMTHDVTANAWGHFDPMDQGDGFSVTFEDPGVYPYACTYHPGMTGAVVVGDGGRDGTGATVEPLAVPEDVPAGAKEPVVATQPGPEDGSRYTWAAAGGLGLLLGGGTGVLLGRRKRTN